MNGARDEAYGFTLIKYAVTSVAGIIYHASVQAKFYHRHLPLLKTCFIPFGADTELFHSTEEQEEEYVVSFGRIKRDYDTLVEAWSRISNKKTTLKIIGADRVLGEKSLPWNIQLVGAVSIQELKSIIAKCRFVVLPLPYYRYAYGQMSLLQSMSMGKAVIVTKTPSTIDYVKDGNDALFVKPYDVEDLTKKIELLLGDTLLVTDIGKNAGRTIEMRFNEKVMAHNIYEFVNEIIT